MDRFFSDLNQTPEQEEESLFVQPKDMDKEHYSSDNCAPPKVRRFFVVVNFCNVANNHN